MDPRDLGVMDFRGTERFEILRRIGEGGMGVVYEALDRERQEKVALKILLRVSPSAIYRIKKEFRALADVSHPNLVRLHELVYAQDRWFFTMELIHGVNFLHHVRPGMVSEAQTEELTLPTLGPDLNDPHDPNSEAAARLLAEVAVGQLEPSALPPLDLDRLRHALRELAEGLVALHDAGKLHRDIKPGNVIITERRRLVLLDFGLATDVDEDSLAQSALGGVVGTVGYMAPEQALGQALTAASDWYSVGTMLFQALTGRLPYTGSLYQVIFQKQQRDPPRPTSLVASLPGDLDDLCMALLCRDPAGRPAGREILERLGGLPPSIATAPIAIPTPELQHSFIGRDRELKALRDAFEASRERPVVLHVNGAAGIGKSALVRHFLDELEAQSEANVFAGRCYQRELVPYKALDNLIDALSRELRKRPVAQARALLPAGAPSLARLFPVLNRVEAIHDLSAAENPKDPVQVQRQAFDAFSGLLGNLSKQKPVVLCLDDLQWGDADSARLLESTLRAPGAPPLLLIAIYRWEDRESSELLVRLGASSGALDTRDLTLGPLARRAALALARSALTRAWLMAPVRNASLSASRSQTGSGQSDDRMYQRTISDAELERRAEEVVAEAQGSPLLIFELASHTERTEESNPGDSGQSASGPISLKDVLKRRLRNLPAPSRRLLEIIAVADRPVRKSLALRAAQLAPEERRAVALLQADHLIRARLSDGEDELQTYHPRIRPAVIESLTERELRARHEDLVRALEAEDNPVSADLIHHLKESGYTERAVEVASKAAAQSIEAFAFFNAASLYGMAVGISQDGDEDFSLRAQWAEALANAGRGGEASEAYLKAAKKAPSDRATDLYRRAAEQMLRFGKVDQGLEVLQTTMQQFHMELPTDPQVALNQLREVRSRLRVRGLAFQERELHEIPPRVLEQVDICWTAAVGLTMVDMIRASIFISAFLHRALDAGDKGRIARALAMELAYLTSEGREQEDRSLRVLQALESLAEKLDDPYVRGFASLGAGFAALHEGRWRDAVEHCERCATLLKTRTSGVHWELDTAETFTLWGRVYSGRFNGLRAYLERLREDAKTRGNAYALALFSMPSSTSLVWLADDDETRARKALDEAVGATSRSRFYLQHFWELTARVQLDLYSGDGKRAWARINTYWSLIEDSHFTRVQVIRIEALFLRARAALAASGLGDPKLLDVAAEDAERIAKERIAWARPMAAMLRARICATRKKRSEAIRLLKEAVSDFRKSDMELYAVVTERRRAQVLENRALVERCDEAMRRLGVRNPKRMARLLAP